MGTRPAPKIRGGVTCVFLAKMKIEFRQPQNLILPGEEGGGRRGGGRRDEEWL